MAMGDKNGKAVSKPDTSHLVPFQPGFDPRRNITKPGPGRPRDAVRLALLKAGAKRLKTVLEPIADGKMMQKVKANGAEADMEVATDPDQRMKAVEMMLKHGMGVDPASAVQITTEGPTAVFLGLPDLPEG